MMHLVKKVATSALILLLAATVHAAAPRTVNYQAYLKDVADQPVNTAVSMTFRLYAADIGGVVLWSQTTNVLVVDGLLTAALGSSVNPLPAESASAPLWMTIEVNSDGEAVPRLLLGSVTHAVQAQDADALGSLPASQLQSRVSGTCSAGSFVQSVNADGTVNCQQDQNTTYTGADFAVSDQDCPAGQVLGGLNNGGGVKCSGAAATNTANITASEQLISDHASSTANPHSVASAQIGAITTSELNTHTADASAHHNRYTDAAAVAAVKAVDGSGSGFDADNVDGLNSTQFLRSNTSDSFISGTMTLSGTTTFVSNGVTQVGSNSATDDDNIYFDDGASEYLRWADSTSRFELSNDLVVDDRLSIGPVDAGSTPNYNLFRTSVSVVPLSGDMGNSGDVFVGFDLELGGEIYANRTLYMQRNASAGNDADQTIYFYNQDSRQGESFHWNDFESRFEFSAALRAGQTLVANDDIYADADLTVSGDNADIGYRMVSLPPWQLSDTSTCFLDVSDESCYHGSVSFSCASNERIIGGGCSCTVTGNGECYLTRSIASDSNTWNCAAIAPSSGNYIRGEIMCAKIGYGD